MRLLTQTDLVKILGNTYYADCDHSDDELLTQAQLTELLAGLAPVAQPQPVDPLTAEDVYDLQAYFERYFKGQERVRLLRHGYWEQAAQLAPRLRIQDRAKLFGVIWGGVEAFGQLYIRCMPAYRDSTSPPTPAPAGGADPREQSIIDVQTLKGLGTGGGGTLVLTGSNGARVTLPRSEVTALIAELRIVINEQPWTFSSTPTCWTFRRPFREQIKDLPTFLQGADALWNCSARQGGLSVRALLREQELTSMLLCIAQQSGGQNPAGDGVRLDRVHPRRDPEQRSQQPTALFLVLTKFDMEFEEKAGECSAESRWITRWRVRCSTSSASSTTGPASGTPRACFATAFGCAIPTLRPRTSSTTTKMPGIERPAGERKRIELFKQAFLKDTAASAHFQNPEQAWEAGFASTTAASAIWPRACARCAIPNSSASNWTGRPRGCASRWSSAWPITTSATTRNRNWKAAGGGAAGGRLPDRLRRRTAFRRVAARPAGRRRRTGRHLFRIETRLPDEKQAIGAPTIARWWTPAR